MVDPTGHEAIVVSGGKYGNSKGREKNHEFIETGIKKCRELRKANPSEQVTWLVATAGYSQDDMDNFHEVSSDMGVKLVEIDTKYELINYINRDDRGLDSISNISFFSHGSPGVVALGHGQDDEELLNFGVDDVSNVRSSAFGNNCTSNFYSCFAGNDGSSSLASTWVNQAGGTTLACVGKTNYSAIWEGESILNKVSRQIHGFSYYGSENYPVAGKDSFWVQYSH